MRRASDVMPGSLLLWCFAAIYLSFQPLPAWLMPLRPDWLALLVVYGVMRYPQGFGMVSAWIIGLIADGIDGGMLGRHAMALSVVAYGITLLRGRMLLYTPLQQMGVIFVLTVVDQLLCQWVQNMSGHATHSMVFLLGSVSSALCWLIIDLSQRRDRAIDDWNVQGRSL
jgi:rod shape-determining protein MreD